MIENHHTVSGDPRVGLEPGGAETLGEKKGLESVFGGVGASSAMGETDGGIEPRGQSLLHEPMMAEVSRLRRVFNLSGSEIVIILLLALVVLGPEKLPEAIRRFGRVYGELRRVSKGFQSEFKEAFDEPLRELRETAHMTSDAVKKMMDEPTDDVAPSKIDEPVTNDPASGDESPPEGGTS